VTRRTTFLLLILVLLVAPAANAYCATLCLAAAISSGCAHGLQPTDDLPVDKTEPAIAVVWTPVPLAADPPDPPAERTLDAAPAHIPLRI